VCTSSQVRITASRAEVWRVLTDYERLPQFLPHLVHSEIIKPKRGQRPAPGAVRLRQVCGGVCVCVCVCVLGPLSHVGVSA